MRPFEPGDLDALARIAADMEVMRHVLPPLDREGTARLLDGYADHWDMNGFGVFAMTRVDRGDELVGWCGLHRIQDSGDVTFVVVLARDHQRQGLATECGRACARWVLELGLEEIVLVIDPENAPSIAAATKMGAEPAGDRTIDGRALLAFALNRSRITELASIEPRRG